MGFVDLGGQDWPTGVIWAGPDRVEADPFSGGEGALDTSETALTPDLESAGSNCLRARDSVPGATVASMLMAKDMSSSHESHDLSRER